MIKRNLSDKILRLAKSYPIVSLTGPRQSGKTTLVKDLFSGYAYVSLEDLDMRRFAQEDPRGFLSQYDKYVIFDEIQNTPELFSYLQGVVDRENIPGQYILTGSQNFLLSEKISQSLAGRSAILHLLPLEMSELGPDQVGESVEHVLLKGFYPRVFHKNMVPNEWYTNYLRTYVERDIRQIKQIQDLGTFQLFLKMCAARTGQLLDLTSLGNDCGISHNTAKAWLNVLESSFIVFFLRPHFKNYNKRLVKTPKLYFYDTGLLCTLLDIQTPEQLRTHYLRGGIFESFAIAELKKRQFHQTASSQLYFWRDHSGHEVDCVLDKGGSLYPVEIKATMTVTAKLFDQLNFWNRLSGNDPQNGYLIYGGDQSQQRSQGNAIGWKSIDRIEL